MILGFPAFFVGVAGAPDRAIIISAPLWKFGTSYGIVICRILTNLRIGIFKSYRNAGWPRENHKSYYDIKIMLIKWR